MTARSAAGSALAAALILAPFHTGLSLAAAFDPSGSQDTPSALATSTLEFDKAFVDSRVGLSLNSAVAEGATYTVIEKVFEGGLAAAAGFREGDVVVSVNSEAVTDPDQGAALIKQAEGVVRVAVARLPQNSGSPAGGDETFATPSASTSLPFDYEIFMAPGGPGHPSTARPAVVMMTPAGCVSSTCAALAEFWEQVAGAPQFGGQVYSADCAAGTPGEQSMCKNAAAAGLFHPTDMVPVVTFWDGRDWSPYSGKRSLEALAQAIMGALTAPVPAGSDGYNAAAAAAAAALSAPEDAEDAARLVCMQRAFQQPAALASSIPPKRPLRPAAADGPRLEAARAAGGGASRRGRGDPRPRGEHAARLRQRPGHRFELRRAWRAGARTGVQVAGALRAPARTKDCAACLHRFF